MSNRSTAPASSSPIFLRNKLLPAYTVSLGLSVVRGDAGQAADVEALIAEVDRALYRAKQRGRNRVEV